MQLLVVMMKMNALSRDSLLMMSPLMTSIRTERRKAEWNESMKDGKTMTEQINCFPFLAEVSRLYPWFSKLL